MTEQEIRQLLNCADLKAVCNGKDLRGDWDCIILLKESYYFENRNGFLPLNTCIARIALPEDDAESESEAEREALAQLKASDISRNERMQLEREIVKE